MVAERGFYSCTPIFILPSAGWAVGILVWGARGLLLCCIALSASGVYRLTTEELRQVCLERELDSSGPVRVLRQRLVDHVKGNAMASSGGEDEIQASVMTDSKQRVVNLNS